jgi:hypothetical protein
MVPHAPSALLAERIAVPVLAFAPTALQYGLLFLQGCANRCRVARLARPATTGGY